MKRPLPKGVKLNSHLGKRAFKGERFDVYQWEQKMFDGTTATFETLKRKDTVEIIPVMNQEVILINERQPHWDADGLCMVAGGVEEDEELEDAARRELEEETGMVFSDFFLVDIDQTVKSIEWFIYTFVATGYQKTVEKKLDAGEKIDVKKVSFEELIHLARTRSFYHHPRIVEKYLIEDKMPEFLDLLKNPKKYQIV